MAYSVVSQNNTVTKLEDDQGNVIHVPAIASLAKSSDYTIIGVKNSKATLEDGNGKVHRNVPCVVLLADDSSNYTKISQNNTKATLENTDGNVINVPSKVILATATDYTLVKVNNSTATLEDASGNIIRDVPCVSMLSDESNTISTLNNSTASLLDGNGQTVNDVPCIVVLLKASGGAVVVIIKGTSPLSLPDAIADSLSYVKAFGGTEQRNLPDGYIERQFIYMMADSYLLTDIIPTYDGHYELDFQTTTVTASRAWLGARNAAYNGLFVTPSSTKEVIVDAFGANDGTDRWTTGWTPSDNTRYKFVFNNKVATFYQGDTVIASNTFTSTGTTTRPLAIKANNDNGTIASAGGELYVYGFKAWNAQGELVADYVPAVQKGTVPVVGFYDTVSGTFKTATAGTFAAGGEAVPTPDAPMDIVCNNGVLKLLESATGITTQAGTPTPTNPIPLVSYQNGSLILRSVGEYADTYSASTQAVSRKIAVVTFTGQETWVIYGGEYFSRGYPDRVPGPDTPVLCTHYPNDTSAPKYVSANGTNRIIFSDSRFENVEDFTAWLAEQYAAGTPVTIYYPLATETTETAGSFVYADGTVETIEDTIGNTATAEMLLKVGDYQDVQSIIDGVVTRNVGVKVLDGTETIDTSTDVGSRHRYTILLPNLSAGPTGVSYSTHFIGGKTITQLNADSSLDNATTAYTSVVWFYTSTFATANDLKQFFADQYAAGTPVILMYPLSTATTESVTGQTLQVTDGDNVLEITQASLNGLELEAEYQAAVSLTIQEVQDANLDPNVEVTIN